MTIVNGLSVDVEDWFQVGAFEHTIAREDWDGLELRVGDNVARILDLFDEAGVKATFFTLGWIAERNRAAMRAIVDRGHERQPATMRVSSRCRGRSLPKISQNRARSSKTPRARR